jgi:hypothetical protein
MRAALRDKRRATAIEREVEITLLRAAAMDVWNAVPLGVVLPPEYVQAINRLGCAIRGEWHLLATKPDVPMSAATARERCGERETAGDMEGAKATWAAYRAQNVPVAPEPGLGDSQVAAPPALIDPGATSSETPRCCENECEDRAEHDEFDPGP